MNCAIIKHEQLQPFTIELSGYGVQFRPVEVLHGGPRGLHGRRGQGQQTGRNGGLLRTHPLAHPGSTINFLEI